ncbi:DUF2634 domain-containing protein [Veillonella intestinalis]|uniref:DUF2634 domain-containing protein n=1 Tax=Veillonella intestinalis TaxID=2941341 RepID=UPI00203E6DA2|nr:DUF2634 domain-containing protein [Veillonella intestinalis]
MSDNYPFVTGANAKEEAKKLPVFTEFAWDFDTNTFKYDSNGRRKTVVENEALKVWIYKALQTERYQYLAYSWQYGIEVKPFIGKVMQVKERYLELKRVIVECLMVNPYIISIDSVDFTTKEDTVLAEIYLTTVYGEVNVNV